MGIGVCFHTGFGIAQDVDIPAGLLVVHVTSVVGKVVTGHATRRLRRQRSTSDESHQQAACQLNCHHQKAARLPTTRGLRQNRPGGDVQQTLSANCVARFGYDELYW